jgi:palmitoyltransferase ZDHHC9/14/18
MSTPPPHSLSFSPSIQHSINANIKRNSLGSNQLPLPSGLNAPVAQRGPVGTQNTNNAGPSSPRGLGAGRASETFQSPNSPILANFSIPQPTPHIHTSSTHAGGIQPAAAFFRPSRPTYQPQYSRPSSPSSLNVPQEDHFQLAPIASHYDSDEHHIAESIAGGNESEHEQHFMSIKRMKQSREPLLPGPSTAQPRPSMSASNSTPATRLVRSSLDRVLSISRGISFDSMRKSTSTRTPQPPSAEGRPTFESKISDEENRYSPTNYKNSNGRSLDVPTPRNSALLSAPSPSPDPSFIPTPPNRHPPLSAVPVINPNTGKPVRRYQQYPSRNRFLFGGRLLTGGDTPWAFIASFGVVISIAGVWFGTTAIWWWQNESPAVAAVGAYLALLTISTMLATVSFCKFTLCIDGWTETICEGYNRSWNFAPQIRPRSPIPSDVPF